MMTQAIVFLVDTVLGLYALALLLRFLLQLVRAPARNQVSHFIGALTDPVVRPARRIVPGWGGFDLSTLLLAWLCRLLLRLTVALLDLLSGGFGSFPLLTSALMAALDVLRLGLYVAMGAVILQAVLSWVAPFSPLAPVVDSLTRPMLRPIQRRVPTVGNVDLSPLVLLILLQLILMVPLQWLTSLVLGSLAG
jgi:YggT family protein